MDRGEKVASLLGISITPQINPSLPSTLTDALQSDDAVHIKQASSVETVFPQVAAESFQTEASPSELQQPTSKQSLKSSQFSWWVMATLFGLALVMAAWLNPSAEPVPTDAPPPLQILSSDMPETASSAAGVVQDGVSSASAASQVGVILGDEPASPAASATAVRASNAAEAASK